MLQISDWILEASVSEYLLSPYISFDFNPVNGLILFNNVIGFFIADFFRTFLALK